MSRFICFALLIAVAIGCSMAKPTKPGNDEPRWTKAPGPPPPEVLEGKRIGVGPGSWPGFGQKQYEGPVPQGTETATRPAQMPTGMIQEIEATFKPLQGHARFYEGQRLLTIEFINARIAEGTLKRLEPYSRYITSLKFEASEVSDSELQTLPELPWVMWLEMKKCRGYTDRGIEKIASMKRLKSILMEGAPIGDDATMVIGQFQTLETLDLSSTHITDEGLKNLGSLSKLTSLKLNRTPITGSGFKYLTRLSKLTSLQLMESKVTDEGLSQMGYLPALTSIVLDRTAVGDAGLKAIVANVPTLVSFNLKGTQVTDAGVVSLTNLPACHRVELSKSRVTKLGIDAIKAKFPKVAIAGP